MSPSIRLRTAICEQRLDAHKIAARYPGIVVSSCGIEDRQRLAIGRGRLVEPGGAALALAEQLQRSAEIVLCRGPVERHALARPLFKGLAIGGDGLVEVCGVALALAERLERNAEIVLRHGPVE